MCRRKYGNSSHRKATQNNRLNGEEGMRIMEQAKNETTSVALETIITNAVKIPGVKVNRSKFLAEAFAGDDIDLQTIIDMGPVSAGIPQERIEKAATKLIFVRTSQSSVASFVAGIPGGFAMAATIPADVAQFFGMTLRLAQELSYLYGASDLWTEDQLDDERVRNQLILYCGVMFGVSGAVSGVRVLSTQIAKTTLKKLPQKALTKTFWYPIIKQISKAIGVKVTKTTVTQGISKAVPIVGGVISGSLNYVSMMPMANRLNAALDKACFNYSEEEMAADIEMVESNDAEASENAQPSQALSVRKHGKRWPSGGLEKGVLRCGILAEQDQERKARKKGRRRIDSYDEKIETLRKLKQLVDEGILSQDEFDAKKKEILAL